MGNVSDLILASSSPRRKELLEQIAVDFTVLPVDICEDVHAGESPEDYVQRLALEKAQACLQKTEGEASVLGSDTTVVFDGEILGKPANEQEAVDYLMRLSGNWHQVLTAVAVVNRQQSLYSVVKTDVQFITLTPELCRKYWHTGEPLDKAGAYGIQGLGAIFVKSIKGSYSAVVGLPLCETAALLQQVSAKVWCTD